MGSYECVKVAYENKNAAVRGMQTAMKTKAKRYSKKSGPRGYAPSTYKCRHCGMWHWGHLRTGEG